MISRAIISDVHANLEALNRVLERIDEERVDALLFLGDSVGYGPDANECVELLQARADVFLAGNHDWGALGHIRKESFNFYAQAALEWTKKELRSRYREYLENIPLTKRFKEDSIFLVHSAPREPEKWHYVSSGYDAEQYFPWFQEQICFLGHSHIPFIAERTAAGTINVYDRSAEIRNSCRYIVNTGSVGQPRDGNPQASFAVLRGNRVELKRVSYDIVVTQKKMQEAGLPEYLIERLALGR